MCYDKNDEKSVGVQSGFPEQSHLQAETQE